MNLINHLNTLIIESKKIEVLVNKLGIKQKDAEIISNESGAHSVFMANKLLDKFEKENNLESTGETIINRFAKMNETNFVSKSMDELHYIIDWVRVGLNGNIKQYSNLTFDELYDKSNEWHESLGVGDSKIDYVEENPIIIDFRENGIGYYWVDLETTYCSEEKERMGHCASSRGYLYSLREYKSAPNGHTFNQSHLTAAIKNDSLLQLKGPKNSEPDSKYNKYILALLTVKINGELLVKYFDWEYSVGGADFELDKLPDDDFMFLLQENPSLVKSSYYGFKKLVDLGLLEIPETVDITIDDYLEKILPHNYSAEYVKEILDGDRELYDYVSYSYEDVIYYIERYANDENKKIIEDNGLDEDITNAVNNSIIYTYESEGISSRFSDISSYFHEYGDVLSLDSNSVDIRVKTSDYIRDIDEDIDEEIYQENNYGGSFSFDGAIKYIVETNLKRNLYFRDSYNFDAKLFNEYLNDYL